MPLNIFDMDKKIVQQVILETLEAVNDQVKMISGYQDKIPWIEIDITKDYLRTLYENILVLERYNGVETSQNIQGQPINENEASQFPEQENNFFAPAEKPENVKNEEKVIAVEEKEDKEQLQQVQVEKEAPAETILPEKTPQTPPDNSMEKTEDHEEEPEKKNVLKKNKKKKDKKAAKQDESGDQKKTKDTKPQELKIFDLEEDNSESIEPQKEGKTIADQLSVEKKSIGETMNQQEKTLAENIGKKPIRKLSSAIGINDKFYFVNELFKGVLTDYNETINVLDSAADFENARQIMDNKISQYNWDSSSEPCMKLREFVERKYQ